MICEHCDQIAVGRGWCRFHYNRWHRFGDPLAQPRKTPSGTAAAFLLSHVGLRSDTCLLWPFSTYSNGYGRLTYEGKVWVASNLMCTIVHGPAPTKDHETAHSCGRGNKGCITPNHVRWRTPAENQMERVSHGTSNRGSRHGLAKLDERKVRKIEQRLGRESQAKIAASIGVSQTAVSEIATGKTWSWLTGRSHASR